MVILSYVHVFICEKELTMEILQDSLNFPPTVCCLLLSTSKFETPFKAKLVITINDSP